MKIDNLLKYADSKSHNNGCKVQYYLVINDGL